MCDTYIIIFLHAVLDLDTGGVHFSRIRKTIVIAVKPYALYSF